MHIGSTNWSPNALFESKKALLRKSWYCSIAFSHCFPGVCADEKYGEEHEKDRSPPCKTMKISLHSIMVTKFRNRNFGLPEIVIKMVKCNLFTHIYHYSFGNKRMNSRNEHFRIGNGLKCFGVSSKTRVELRIIFQEEVLLMVSQKFQTCFIIFIYFLGVLCINILKMHNVCIKF